MALRRSPRTTITVEITPEIQAELARQAAAQGRGLEAHAASLLEEAAHLRTAAPASQRKRPPGRKSLVALFAESPLRGLELDFSRNKSAGRSIDL
jgi:hypothetical protein